MHKPGCYGMGVVCNPSHKPCSLCSVLPSCSEESSKALELVNKDIDVSDLMRRHAPTARPPHGSSERVGSRDVSKLILSLEQLELLKSMRVKPAAVAKSLFERGINVGAELRVGRNPFSKGKYSYLSTACRLLLQGGFTKSSLKEALLVDHSHWNERTAEGQVSLIVSLLCALKVTEQADGKIKLRR